MSGGTPGHGEGAPSAAPEPASDRGPALAAGLVAPLGCAALALLVAFLIADVAHPAVVFAKYIAAARAPAAESSSRLLDYSPLYLALVRALVPYGPNLILVVQGVFQAAAAAAAARLVALILDSTAWSWAAGVAIAVNRPLLTYCGIHEPETLILACLALALVAAFETRRLLAAGAALTPAAPRRLLLLWLALGNLGLTAAGLSRPQYLLLVPLWVGWFAAAAPAAQRRRVAIDGLVVALVVGALVVGPPLLTRARVTGVPIVMDPGPVFYEGNGPGATGLIRFAPPAVLALEKAGLHRIDYGHVAYRRIASFAARGPLGPAAANRYWVGLALEEICAYPAAALRRAGRKLLMAVMPYEGHDLEAAERVDRGLRARLPLGCALSLTGLAWIALARRARLIELAPLLSIIALSIGVQVFAYASARQRLPAAYALWIVTTVLAADLVHGRLRSSVRPTLGLLAGAAMPCLLAAASARVAVLDQVGWDSVLGREPSSLGAALSAFQDGRRLRPQLEESARRLDAGVNACRQGQFGSSLELLRPLLGERTDLTIDESTIGVPEYWAGRDLLALGQRPAAATLLREAVAVRPDDPRIAALAMRVDTPAAKADTWRPPGCDPVSARLNRATAAAIDRDRAAVGAILSPLGRDFPDLVRRPTGRGQPAGGPALTPR